MTINTDGFGGHGPPDDGWPDAYGFWPGEHRNQINFEATHRPVPGWVMRDQDHRKRALRVLRRYGRRLWARYR